MVNKDVLAQLFELNDTEELFTVNKEELSKIEKSNLDINKEILNFIDERVHPNSRDELKNLIEKYEEYAINYSYKEREQAYKVGFSDATKIILDAISI